MSTQKIRFTTMFPRIENIHLVKDVGMIPYAMKKYYDFDSSIVIYKNKKYEYFNTNVNNLKKDFFPFRKFNSIINCFCYLLNNSKNIDVLHLYHIGEKTTWISVFTYFLINKKGLIYIHMDENTDIELNDIFGLEEKSLKKIIKKIFLTKFIYTKKNRSRILFGLQNKAGIEEIKGNFPFDNVKYIGNAYEDITDSNLKCKKENIILFVGRVGNKQKRTDILLDGFKKASLKIPNWKLRIVGPIEENFKCYITKFFEDNPQLIDRVEFTGPVYDRNKLKDEYCKAKIFCLTSDYESFGLVTVEALANGCTIVSSNITASKEIINDCEFGNLFECGNSVDLSNKLINTCNDFKLLNYVQKNCKEYIKNNYSYQKSLKSLDVWIKEHIK